MNNLGRQATSVIHFQFIYILQVGKKKKKKTKEREEEETRESLEFRLRSFRSDKVEYECADE